MPGPLPASTLLVQQQSSMSKGLAVILKRLLCTLSRPPGSCHPGNAGQGGRLKNRGVTVCWNQWSCGLPSWHSSADEQSRRPGRPGVQDFTCTRNPARGMQPTCLE